MIKKDRSAIVNKTYLMKMLPLLYQTHLENQLSASQLLFFSLIINVLQDVKSVSLEKLAATLPLPILFESRRKKIQRFLSLPIFQIEKLWFGIIKDWLAAVFTSNQTIYAVIDRTSWGCINLMMISIVYDHRAIPIYWEMLPKLGSSSFTEQANFLTKVLSLLTINRTIVLGDREFCSAELANWLREKNLYFCLRLKKSEYIQAKTDFWYQLSDIRLKPGCSIFLQGINVTKTHQIKNLNFAGLWKRNLYGVQPKEAWFILTNLGSLKAAIAAYKQRFDIEEMFKDFKSGGYNLEETNVSDDRLTSLILIIAFAYTLATLNGQKIKKKGVQKYIGRVKEYGRSTRRHSSFYIGLYSQGWVNCIEPHWDIVMQLMKLNRNKLEYYLRGLRAMKLILSLS